MCENPLKSDGRLANVNEQTEIIEAEFHVTKYVATFSGKRSVPLSGDVQGSADVHSDLVDGAIKSISSNLPAEVLRVTRLQRHQGSHISLLQSQLSHLQEQKRRAMAKTAEVREEVERTRRQGFLLEEDCSRKNNRCILLKDEILALVKDSEDKRRLQAAKRSELQTLRKQVEKYGQTLDDLTTSVAVVSTGSSEVQARIAQVEDRLATLTEKRDFLRQNPEEAERIRGGSAEREVQERLREVTAECGRLQGEVSHLRQQVDAVRAKQEQVKQATAVLRKRNAAQVLRLKRQVKEQQVRHRQWTEQRRLLTHTVTTLTHRLQSA